MKIREFFRKHKKKMIVTAIPILTILVIAGGMLFGFWRKSTDGDGSFLQGSSGLAGGQMTGMVSASGVTSIGMIQENLEVENLSGMLYVEEVYLTSDQEVREGDTVLKLKEESVEEARTALEKVLREADLAYRAGVIEYEQSKITAAYDRDIAVLNGEQAQEVYDATVSTLTANLEQAQENLDSTNEEIVEYQAIIDSNDYYTYYKVDEYKQIYDENLELLKEKMSEWGASWSQVLGSASGSMSGGTSGGSTSGGGMGNDGTSGSTSGSSMSDSGMPGGTVSGESVGMQGRSAVSGGDSSQNMVTTPSSDQLMVLRSLYSVLEQNLADYDQAVADYEEAAVSAGLNLQTLKLSLNSLEQAVAEAKTNYETQLLEAKLTLESTLADAQRAESDYEAAMEKAESDYETLKDTWEDARENLKLFESCLGDGYYRAAGSGAVMRTMVRAGQYLNSDSTIFIYRDSSDLTVTVSVSQENIAAISVGDEAYIQSSENGSFRGVVTQINPISASGSRANVTYQVTVALNGESGELGNNETVTVLFGIGGGANEEES